MHAAVQKQIRLHPQFSVRQELCHPFLHMEPMEHQCAEKVDRPDHPLGDTSQSDGLWIVPYLSKDGFRP